MENIEYCMKVLGLEPGASESAIKDAYHDLITVWRPDKYEQDSRLQKKAIEKLKEIDEAYRALTRRPQGKAEIPVQNKVEPIQLSSPSPETNPDSSSIPRANAPDMTASRIAKKYKDTARDKSVGGWLLTLCIFMTCIWPITGILGGFATLRQADNFIVTIFFWIQIIGSIFCLYSGVQLWGVKEGAVSIARNCFIFLMVWHGLFLFLSETKVEMIQGVVGVLFCFTIYLYLTNSKRVQRTYNSCANKTSAKQIQNGSSNNDEYARALARQQLRDAFNSVNKDLSTADGINKAEGKLTEQVVGAVVPQIAATQKPPCAANGDEADAEKSVSEENQTTEAPNITPVDAGTSDQAKIGTVEDPSLGMPSVEVNKGSSVPLFFRVVGFLIMSLIISVIALALGFSIFERKHASAPNQQKITSAPSGNAAAVNASAAKSSGVPGGLESGTAVVANMKPAGPAEAPSAEKNSSAAAPFVRMQFENGESIDVPREWKQLNRDAKEAINFLGESNRETILKNTGLPVNPNINSILVAANAYSSDEKPSATMRLSVRHGTYPSQIEFVGVELTDTDRAELTRLTRQMLAEIRHTMPGMIKGQRILHVGIEKLGGLYSLIILMQIDYVYGTYIERLDQIFMGDRVYKLHTSYRYSETSTYEAVIQSVRKSFRIS